MPQNARNRSFVVFSYIVILRLFPEIIVMHDVISGCVCFVCIVIEIRLKVILPVFGRPFVKRFTLCYQTVVCPVCL